jgi:hypothetical protein
MTLMLGSVSGPQEATDLITANLSHSAVSLSQALRTALVRRRNSIIRGCSLLIVASLALLPVAAAAQERSAAIFDFELTDTSRDNQLAPFDAEHQARLAAVSARLRTRLSESGRFTVTDITPVAKEAQASNLQSCGGCDVSLAGKVGADLAITGMVYKVSNLILNMMIFVRDAKTGNNLAVAQADMRGDTDESWNRTLDWLVRNRLLAPDYGVRQ